MTSHDRADPQASDAAAALTRLGIRLSPGEAGVVEMLYGQCTAALRHIARDADTAALPVSDPVSFAAQFPHRK